MKRGVEQTTWIFLLVIIALLFVFYATDRVKEQKNTQLTEVRALNTELLEQYKSAVTTNRQLREQTIILQNNLTTTSARATACFLQLPEPVMSPTHRIAYEDLQITDRSVVINAKDITPGITAPTGSMHPLLGAGTVVLEVTPQSSSEILPGDIIVYEYGGSRVIHRVVQIGWDARGWFALTKGDSNRAQDPEKVRFSQVRGVVVAIIY